MWDVIASTAIVYSLIEVPYRIGFLAPSQSDNNYDYLVDIIFFIDIVLTFNTTFIDTNTDILITSRPIIASQYLKFWFWLDLLSTVPFDFFVRISTNSSSLRSGSLGALKLFRILRLTRLTKLYRIVKSQSFEKFLEATNISPKIISFTILIAQIFLFAHIVACFWYYISTPFVTGYYDTNDFRTGSNINGENYVYSYNSTGITWVINTGLQNADTTTKYIASLYWTMNTLLSIGYGDIVPVSTNERLYALTVMLLGGLMFGAIVAKVKGKNSFTFINLSLSSFVMQFIFC